MDEPALPVYVLKRFSNALRAQVGVDTLKAVVENAGLPTDWVYPRHMLNLDDVRAAQVYLQL